MAKKKAADIEKFVTHDNEVVSVCDQPLAVRQIENMIFTIRGVHVMFDCDLAMLYGVETKRLKEQVKRNINRFPDDFMFQLTIDEAKSSRSQIATLIPTPSRSQFATLDGTTEFSKSQNVTLSAGRRHNIKYLPYVFTENGVAMLSSVLRSQMAIEVNILAAAGLPSPRWKCPPMN